jgi:hypothetical protein
MVGKVNQNTDPPYVPLRGDIGGNLNYMLIITQDRKGQLQYRLPLCNPPRQKLLTPLINFLSCLTKHFHCLTAEYDIIKIQLHCFGTQGCLCVQMCDQPSG